MKTPDASSTTDGTPQMFHLGPFREPVQNQLSSWSDNQFASRLWNRDPGLWFDQAPGEIRNRLGWLDLPSIMENELEELQQVANTIHQEKFSNLILLGMGGSSLAPEIFQRIFGSDEGHPDLTVLDSTHPGAINAIEERISLDSTLFLVASKSGTTTETLSLFRYFWHRTRESVSEAGRHFLATTDPGSPLEQLAHKRSFRHVFIAPEDLGGRYSALSHFGLAPAALIGLDINRFLNKARQFSETCGPTVSVHKNPALKLGAAIGELARQGRNKMTFLTTPGLNPFPDWLEQLIAESTGKDGTGIVPIVNEPEIPIRQYESDRVFVELALETERTTNHKERLQSLRNEGHPVISIHLSDRYDLPRELFRWEMAISAAGAILGIHPFNQPDVEQTKAFTREALTNKPSLEKSLDEIEKIENIRKAAHEIREHLNQMDSNGYIAIQAFLNPENQDLRVQLQRLRTALLKQKPVSTTFGYGPRFLHSTGQLHKGGPDSGIFLQLVDETNTSPEIPEQNHTFSELLQAQSSGDYQALKKQNRTILRINLGKTPLQNMLELVEQFSP